MNNVEVPIRAGPKSIHAGPSAGSSAPQGERAQQLSAPGEYSSPFPVYTIAADGYLVRWAALEAAPALSLSPQLLCSTEVSLRGAASEHASSIKALVRAALPGPSVATTTVNEGKSKGRLAHGAMDSPHAHGGTPTASPYALVPSLFGPCLPYAVGPLLRGPLWRDILVAGPVLKYSARRYVSGSE